MSILAACLNYIFRLNHNFIAFLSYCAASQCLAANATDLDIKNDLYRAMMKNHEQIQLVINNIPVGEINYPYGSAGESLLHFVSKAPRRVPSQNLVYSAKLLLDKGADPNRRDNNHRTAISYLGGNHQGPLFDYLVANGADLTAVDSSGRTLAHHYAASRNGTFLSKLIDHKAPLDELDSRSWTPLSEAASRGDRANIKSLIDQGANLGIRDKNGNNLLHLAARRSSIKVVDLLSANGDFDINERNSSGKTVVALFADRNQWAAVRLLAERGVNLNVPFKRASSLSLYLYLNPKLGFSDLVDRESLAPNLARSNGRTELNYAVLAGDVVRVSRLLELGAKPANNDKNPLIYNVVTSKRLGIKNKKELILKLINHGADPNQHSHVATRNPLQAAAIKNDKDLVMFLIDQGAEPNFSRLHYFSGPVLSNQHYDLFMDIILKVGTEEYFLGSFWHDIFGLAKLAASEEKDGAIKIGKATKIYLFLMKQRPVVDFADRNGHLRKIMLDQMAEMNSVVVLEGLNHVRYVNERKKTNKPQHLSYTRNIPVKSNSEINNETLLSLPDEADLHVVGVYEAENKPAFSLHSCLASASNAVDVRKCHELKKRRKGRVEIVVYTEKPVILVLMAYEPVDWVIRKYGDMNIKGVILSGYHQQKLVGLSPSIPIFTYTNDDSPCRVCKDGQGYFYAYKRSGEEYKRVVNRLKSLTGRQIETFQGKYKGRSFLIK